MSSFDDKLNTVLWAMRREGELRVMRENKELFPNFKDSSRYTVREAKQQIKDLIREEIIGEDEELKQPDPDRVFLNVDKVERNLFRAEQRKKLE